MFRKSQSLCLFKSLNTWITEWSHFNGQDLVSRVVCRFSVTLHCSPSPFNHIPERLKYRFDAFDGVTLLYYWCDTDPSTIRFESTMLFNLSHYYHHCTDSLLRASTLFSTPNCSTYESFVLVFMPFVSPRSYISVSSSWITASEQQNCTIFAQ